MDLIKGLTYRDVFNLQKKYKSLRYATNSGWIVGSATIAQSPVRLIANSGESAGSTALASIGTFGLRTGGGESRVNFNKRMLISTVVLITSENAAFVRYLQLKQGDTHGDMTAKGVGIKINNAGLFGESFGTERGEVDLATTLTTWEDYKLDIEVNSPEGFVKWYVDGVLVGTQTSAVAIPSGRSNNYTYFVLSATNGVAAERCAIHIAPPLILQEV